MKRTKITAAALSIALTPVGVDAEILSQARLNEILTSDAPGPVSVETLRSRDKELLIALGITLREKYGSVLTGSEIVFTRSERAGRIVYRMDFLNVKSEDHAKGICEILEVENCLILGKNGVDTLVSAEIDSDGLMSLDEYVPFSGVVRMQKLPHREGAASMRLPQPRPGAVGGIEKKEKTEPAPAESAPAVMAPVEQPTTESAPEGRVPAKLVPMESVPADVVLEKPEVSIERPEPASIKLDLPEIEVERRQGEDADAEQVAPSNEQEHSRLLPKKRPGEMFASADHSMVLPAPRPKVSSKLAMDAMPLPQLRPGAMFGIQNHLPLPRGEAMKLAAVELDGEGLNTPMISGGEQLLPSVENGFVLSADFISTAMDGFSLDVLEPVRITLPGVGEVELDDSIPSISVAMEEHGALMDPVLQGTENGIEMEVSEKDAEKLPRVFVLRFGEDGVKAFASAETDPAAKNFEIASVVMNDSFSSPFDVRGDGHPELQKLPGKRPEFSGYDGDVHLVSGRGTDVLLDRLLDDPVMVAQNPVSEDENSPGARLMRRLSGDVSEQPLPVSEQASAEPVEQPQIVSPDPVTVPMPADGLVRKEDGLADLDAEASPGSQSHVMNVLQEIAQGSPAAIREQVPTTVKVPAAAAAPAAERGIFDVARVEAEKTKIQSRPHLRIELSYASSRQEVEERAKALEAFIPEVIMKKGRFYGYRMQSTHESYVIGIEAEDLQARDDIVWYLERMQIPWAVSTR